jgi:FkbM family methyltransferase
MNVREPLLDVFYAMLIRPRLGLSPNALAKIVNLLRMRECLLRNRVNLVLDVGGNVGRFVHRIRRLGYRGRVVSFEPDPHAFAQLVRRWGRDPAWTGHPFALGDADGEQTLNLASDSQLTSFLDARADIVVRGTAPVTMRRLDSVFGDLSRELTEPRVFLKLDTQGYDLHVLKGASACLHQIQVLLSEISVIPIYEEMTPYHEALRQYADFGFGLVDFSVVTRTREGHAIELDCLLERRRAELGRKLWG